MSTLMQFEPHEQRENTIFFRVFNELLANNIRPTNQTIAWTYEGLRDVWWEERAGSEDWAAYFATLLTMLHMRRVLAADGGTPCS